MTPERMCACCRTMRPKQELYRIVKNSAGEIFADETGKAPGRGAYICKTGDCREKAEKNRCFDRAFKCQVPRTLYEQLKTM